MKYRFYLQFRPTQTDEPKPIDTPTRQRVIAAVSQINPPPKECAFNAHHSNIYPREGEFVGQFYLKYVIDARSQFAASQTAALVSEQVTKLALDGFQYELTDVEWYNN